MVISCVAYGCQNRQDERPKSEVSIDRIPVSFHRFPVKKDLRDHWIKSVKGGNGHLQGIPSFVVITF